MRLYFWPDQIHLPCFLKKEEVYLSKAQIQRLCEIYQEEEHPITSLFLKKTKKQAALIRIKEALENDYEDLPKFTGIILILF
jgi:hypothetical protein